MMFFSWPVILSTVSGEMVCYEKGSVEWWVGKKTQSNYYNQGNLINNGPEIPSNTVNSQCRLDITFYKSTVAKDLIVYCLALILVGKSIFFLLRFDVDLFSLQSLYQLL